MNLAEKILARSAGLATVRPGQFVTSKVDRIMVNDNIILLEEKFRQAGITELHDPERLVVVFDHVFPAPTVKHADMIASGERFMENLGVRHYLGAPGVAHQVLCERGYIMPGELVLGSDSHSTMYGALGAAGAGIGITEMTYLLATGELWMQVPETIRFDLEGALKPMVASKDVVLHLIGRFGGDYGQYRAIEYGGEAVAAMTVAQRMTIANMGAEFGAKFALFEADEKTCAYLADTEQVRNKHRPLDSLTPDLVTPDPFALDPFAPGPFAPDEDASYLARHRIDISDLEPQVACPHSPDNVRPITDVRGTRIQQAYLGSCTNARLEDLKVAAELLRGRRIAPGVRLLVVPASQAVMLDATRAGYMEDLLQAGAHVLPTGCGACAGLHSGLLGETDVCISSTNRNFPGRMGSTQAQLYLASPAVVAASAIKGEIADPRELHAEAAA